MQFSPALVRALLIGAGILLYALAMHYTSAVNPIPHAAAALVIAPFAVTALISAWGSPARPLLLGACGLAGGLIAGFWNVFTDHLGWLYYLQHVGIYGLLALMFGRTLTESRVPLCTQIGYFLHDEMTERVLRYTRQVTVAWTAYFLATVAISTLLFFFASFEAWSIFGNVLGAPLMATMFLLEYVVRCRVLPPAERASLANTWRAWKRHSAGQPATRPTAGQEPPAT